MIYRLIRRVLDRRRRATKSKIMDHHGVDEVEVASQEHPSDPPPDSLAAAIASDDMPPFSGRGCIVTTWFWPPCALGVDGDGDCSGRAVEPPTALGFS